MISKGQGEGLTTQVCRASGPMDEKLNYLFPWTSKIRNSTGDIGQFCILCSKGFPTMCRRSLLDAGYAASSKVIQGTEVDGTLGNVVEQETISTRGFPFR